jgi:hypothetical protein
MLDQNALDEFAETLRADAQRLAGLDPRLYSLQTHAFQLAGACLELREFSLAARRAGVALLETRSEIQNLRDRPIQLAAAVAALPTAEPDA